MVLRTQDFFHEGLGMLGTGRSQMFGQHRRDFGM
jgi:hypothetical protein